MATADASGPLHWPLIDGIVAVNALVVLPLRSKRCCKSRLVSFLVGFQNAEPDPVSYPDSRLERGAERHDGLMEITGGGRLGKVA